MNVEVLLKNEDFVYKRRLSEKWNVTISFYICLFADIARSWDIQGENRILTNDIIDSWSVIKRYKEILLIMECFLIVG